MNALARGSRGILAAALAVQGVQGVEAQRPVAENRIRSSELPEATIVVDPTLRHIGQRTFTLYGVADVELHVFAETDGDRVKRLLWIQFEGYRDDNTHTYDYSSDPAADIDGHPFHTNYRFYPASGLGGRAGSDGDHVVRLLEEAGLVTGPELARLRLVWLLNDPPRDELMLIYVEDLADLGTSIGDLEADPDAWAALRADLLERASASFEIRP